MLRNAPFAFIVFIQIHQSTIDNYILSTNELYVGGRYGEIKGVMEYMSRDRGTPVIEK